MEMIKTLSKKVKQNKKRNILIRICNYLKKRKNTNAILIPYFSQQNRIAKRKNRLLLEMTILFDVNNEKK